MARYAWGCYKNSVTSQASDTATRAAMGRSIVGEFRNQVHRDVAERMPSAVTLFVSMISVGFLIEAYHYPHRLNLLLLCVGGLAITCFCGNTAVRIWPERSAATALVTVILLAALLALYLAVVHGSGELALLALIGYLTGVVVQFPWGARYQAGAAAGVLAIYLSTFAVGTAYHLPAAYGMFAIVTHAIMTVLGASLLERYRWSAFREAAEAARLAAEAARANSAKTDFIATVSHELRTPLNIIFGYTDLLMEEAFVDDGERRDALRRIRAQSGNLLDMIQAMLDISKLEAGGVQIDAADIRLGELMNRLAGAVPASWCKQGVLLKWDATPQDVVLHSDADKIEIIVRNLIHNALKYTDQGEVRVGASVTPDGNAVEFIITDTGQGITGDDLERIFEMFQQSGGGPPRQGGVGLGLFLVKRLTTALGGSIRAESQLGRGSRFGVTLPLATVAAAATVPSSPTETRHAPGMLVTTSKVDEVPV